MDAESKDRNMTLVPEAFEDTSLKQDGSYTWIVEDFSMLDESRIYSPEFEVGGYFWDSFELTPKYISVYLDFPEAEYTPSRMYPTAKFELVAVKSTNHGDPLTRESTHTFTAQTSIWGFNEFLTLRNLQNPELGFLVNDILTLRVNIYIQENNLGMMSKTKTGFVGIKSHGETSLLSSFLQCLFHIKAFRKAVFQMSTVRSDDPQQSLPLALQHLFYNLQYQSTSAKIKDLVKALNWYCTDRCLQYDVFEAQCMLFGKLSQSSEACNAKGCISKLFVGEYWQCIESTGFKETVTSKQSYMEIPLDVLGCRDIYASLERLCLAGRSKEDNHDQTTSDEEGEPKQYVLFDSFPTILQLNLKRCHYNTDRRAILKINSNYEFYDELDLDYNDRVLQSNNSNRVIENKYRLHSVLVHKGGDGGNGYFVFIRRHKQWFKFDNEVVEAVSLVEAIDAQFGDQHGISSANFSKGFESIKKSTAVMLIYIRKSEWNNVMCNAKKKCLPKQIRQYFEKERIEKEERQAEKQEAHLYVILKLATEFHFAEQIGEKCYFNLVDFEAIKNYRVYKKTLFVDFKEMVSNDFEIPKHLLRFWLWNARTNNTLRVSKPLIEGGIDLKTVLDLRHFRDEASPLDQEENALMTINLFLESPKEASMSGSNLRPIHESEVLIFLKYYDPESSRLSYLGRMFIDKTCPFRVIFDKAKRMAGLAPEEDIIGFEEVKHLPSVICKELVIEATPQKTPLFQGDIFIIQKFAADSQYEYPTVKSFFEFIQNSTKVNFRPLKNPGDEGFELELSKTSNYQQVTNGLANHLRVNDPKKLRLTQHNVNTRLPYTRPIRYNSADSLEQMILRTNQQTNILYYEVLDTCLSYLETLKCLAVEFHNAKGEWQSTHQLRLPKEKKVSDLIKALKVELGQEYNDCNMRLMQTLFSKVYKMLDPKSLLKEIDESYWIFRAELIPEDQKNLKSDEFLVLFCHCKPGDKGMTVFGDPLWVKVKKGEIVREVKARIQETLEVSNEELSHWRIAYHAHPMHPVEYLEDEDNILAKCLNHAMSGKTNGKLVGDNTSFIALQHDEANHIHPTPY